MKLSYIPLLLKHVEPDNHFKLTQKYTEQLRNLEVRGYIERSIPLAGLGYINGRYARYTALQYGQAKRFCYTVKREDEDAAVKIFYGDCHMHVCDFTTLTKEQAEWLHDNTPETLPFVVSRGDKQVIYFANKLDAMKFQLAC